MIESPCFYDNIAELEKYIQKKIGLILTSHYVVENLEDVKTKIEYLKGLKNIAFKTAVHCHRGQAVRFYLTYGIMYIIFFMEVHYECN